MNPRLEEAIERIKALPGDRQQEVAAMLFELLDVEQKPELYLSPEQIAEIEHCMSDDEPFATEEDVRAVFERLTK
jgi:hypothetical protein